MASSRRGRPRNIPPSNLEGETKDQILDAAAELFVERGIAATTTRMIADRAKMQQGSLYYYFGGKDDIVAELVHSSVRPSVQVMRGLIAAVEIVPDAPVVLLALVKADLQTLTSMKHNVGILYLTPELQAPRFDEFHAERHQLQEAYARIAGTAATPQVLKLSSANQLGELILQLVEVITQLRRSRPVTAEDKRAIARACLRVCGLSETDFDKIESCSDLLLERIKQPSTVEAVL